MVAWLSPRKPYGKRTDPERENMREHVPRIAEQGQTAGEYSAHNLQNHPDQCDADGDVQPSQGRVPML